jgi:uncharacterized protein (TIRG00374 family)
MIFLHVTTPIDPPIVAPSAGRWYRVWRFGRYAIGLAVIGAAAWALSGKTDELRGSSAYLAEIRWEWVVVAAVAELMSYLAYAGMQRRLLKAGDVKIPMAPMTGISLAGNAIQNSLPGGVVFYAAYLFRQYRRFGADEVMAGWTLVAVNALSFIALSLLAAAGLAMALGAGSALDLVEVILGIVAVAALLVAGWVERARLVPRLANLIRLSQITIHRPDPKIPAREIVDGWLDRVGTISPGRSDWAWAAALGASNWIADCACLTLSFVAVGVGVPWRGLLLAYGAAQLATMLPITPGGLGVVEGSLTIALVTFGGGQDSTVAAVLLYRILSFWVVLPVGWGAWGTLALAGRAHSRRAVLETSGA